jgi:uncharacterized protein (TIGR00730 family)
MEENTKTHNKKHSLEDIKNSCELHFGEDGELLELCRVGEELKQGVISVEKYSKLATIYGSARFSADHPYSLKAREVAKRLAQDLGFAVITGGGHGIMEAANIGAKEGGEASIGATIVLPHEQTTNTSVTEEIPFEYFFTRKTVLRYGSELAVYFPGGFGTFDEFFELITLVQNDKIRKIPVILFGSDFWSPLDSFIKKVLLEEFQTIDIEDTLLYTITDSVDEVIELAKKAPQKGAGIGEESL